MSFPQDKTDWIFPLNVYTSEGPPSNIVRVTHITDDVRMLPGHDEIYLNRLLFIYTRTHQKWPFSSVKGIASIYKFLPKKGSMREAFCFLTKEHAGAFFEKMNKVNGVMISYTPENLSGYPEELRKMIGSLKASINRYRSLIEATEARLNAHQILGMHDNNKSDESNQEDEDEDEEEEEEDEENTKNYMKYQEKIPIPVQLPPSFFQPQKSVEINLPSLNGPSHPTVYNLGNGSFQAVYNNVNGYVTKDGKSLPVTLTLIITPALESFPQDTKVTMF